MLAHVLISFLLVCTVAAGPLIDSVVKDSENFINSVEQVAEDLYILDDNDIPVKVNFLEDYPEPLKVTQENLPNRVFFYLYTRETRNNPEILKLNDAGTVQSSHFDPKKAMKIVTHGWTGSANSSACQLINDAFLQHDDCNVIVIDWSSIATKPYIWASNRVVIISQFVAQMIDFLVTQGMDPSQLTTVGHSLGAHIAGLSSYYAKNKANYVVALDPAQPNFLLAGTGRRVNRGDAKYVEVIHTNAGFLGYASSLGDVDFFPNGGHLQNGCGTDIGFSCSHSRSVEYYAESINSKVGFVAKKCKSFEEYVNGNCQTNSVLMGGVNPVPGVKGDYYLRTSDSSPYAMGSK